MIRKTWLAAAVSLMSLTAFGGTISMGVVHAGLVSPGGPIA